MSADQRADHAGQTGSAHAGSAPAGSGLWSGDTGTLHEQSRRALLEILRGPYLSGRQRPQLWAALAADERAIRSRLHDLFLELVIDPVDEFAFVRKVRTDEVDAPSALRSVRMTFLDTVMLLVLRQLLLAAGGERRVIVGQDEVYERLAVYRSTDEASYLRNLNGAWTRMLNRYRVIHMVSDDRAEISPVVKFMIDEDHARSLGDVYRGMADGASTDDGRADDAASTDGASTDDGTVDDDAVEAPATPAEDTASETQPGEPEAKPRAETPPAPRTRKRSAARPPDDAEASLFELPDDEGDS